MSTTRGPSTHDVTTRTGSRSRRHGRATAALMSLAGIAAIASGAALAWAGPLGPEATWIAKKLGSMGISAGAPLAAGTTVLGLGLALAAISRGLAGAAQDEHAGRRLLQSFGAMRKGLAVVHRELLALRESQRQMTEIAQAAETEAATSPGDDPVYRMAASLDQLGRRLEQGLQEQSQHFADRLMGLDRELDATRRQIVAWLEELGTQRSGPVEDLIDLPGEHEILPRRDEHWPDRASATAHAAPEVEELEVLVTLEEEIGGAPEAAEDRSLGLLDDLDDFGEYRPTTQDGAHDGAHPSASAFDLDLDRTPPPMPGRNPAWEQGPFDGEGLAERIDRAGHDDRRGT